MEGGDVVWIDERTVAVGEGYRTNTEGESANYGRCWETWPMKSSPFTCPTGQGRRIAYISCRTSA